MRVLVHDYSGHPFVVPLSNELAIRGHEVTHVWCSSVVAPKAAFDHDLHPDVAAIPVSIGRDIPRGQLVQRWRAERRYARLLAQVIEDLRPNIVISGNGPVDVQQQARSGAWRVGAKFVYWMQDVYWVALRELLPSKISVGGPLITSLYRRKEENLWRSSDAVIAITSDFESYLEAARVGVSGIDVIENWAPIDQLPQTDRRNNWSIEMGLGQSFNFTYTGTLAMKHDPSWLVELAKAVALHDGQVVLVSEGPGADWVCAKASDMGITNLRVLPFQPFERVPEVMGSADVLVALLSASAGQFSVPSKILSYLCAGRPILAAIPGNNLSARVVNDSGAGIVVDPEDLTSFLNGGFQLMMDGDLRRKMGIQARMAAQERSDIESIADRFEAILERLVP